MKDIRTSLLVMLSAGLVGTWIYHLYDKTTYTSKRKEIYIKDSTAVAQGVQDSLDKLYSQKIFSLGTELDSVKSNTGQLQGQLNNKLTEINRLRAELATLLKKKDFNQQDLTEARRKKIELELRISELQNQNMSVEEEKQQIAAALDKANEQVKALETNNVQLDQQNKVLTEKVNQASAFFASDVRLTPVMVKNDKEQETNVAKKTSKLLVSFAVQNNIADYHDAEVFIIITQPDGTLLTNDAWESATTIDTKEDGRKRYTRKIKFEYQRGEPKQLSFSINADEYQKGTYMLQLYHNGYLIGKTIKILG